MPTLVANHLQKLCRLLKIVTIQKEVVSCHVIQPPHVRKEVFIICYKNVDIDCL